MYDLIKSYSNDYFDIYTDKRENISNGIVYKKNSNEQLIPPFQIVQEYTFKSNEYNEWFDTIDISKWKFKHIYEGCMLRVFYYENNWHIITNTRSAFLSRWSCIYSFGDLFIKGIEDEYTYNETFRNFIDSKKEEFSNFLPIDPFYIFLNTLSKKNVHYFIVRYIKENRIYCTPPDTHSKIISIGSIPFPNQSSILEWNSPIEYMKHEKTIILDESKLFNDYMENIPIQEYYGMIGWNDKGEFIKIIHNEYVKYKNIRGNHPNIYTRYYELRNNLLDVNLLIKMFPEHFYSFQKIEKNIRLLCKYIYDIYIKKFIYKIPVFISQRYSTMIYDIHAFYLSKKTKITLSDVFQIWNKYPIKTQICMVQYWELMH